VLLGQSGGSYELSVLLSRRDALAVGPQRTAAVLLVLAGAFTKSAQFPFHFWLPSAMEAPTPVSAYLHSATMVKAGVYLLARLHPLLGTTAEWQLLVAPVGLITLLLGALLAMQVDDLKRILAYSTVSALGLLTWLIGMGSEAALAAAVVFLLGHALYKGALFLVAGAVDHATGTRQADQLGGLGRSMPIVAAAAVVAGLSMAGLPPLFGFIAKERVYEAALGSGEWWAGWTAAMVAAGMLFVAVAGVVAVRPFFGPPVETPRQPHEPPPSLWLGPLVLAGLGLLLGLLPAAEGLLALALAAIRQQPATPLHLGLWHDAGAALALSVLTLLGGLACYAVRGRFRLLEAVRGWGPARGYELGIDGLNRLASLQTRLLQSGYLRYYLMIILLAVSGVVALPLADEIRDLDIAGTSDLRFYEVGLIGLTMLAALFAVRPQPRLAAIATLGVVGYSIALLFVLYGAPDLAMTQFLVETLTVILFVLVFYHLPPSPEPSPAAGRLRDALLALLAGGVMTALVLLAVQTGPLATISGFFVEHSLPAGHGRNVVNVILVDFRGLDTLGEITVLAVAAVGVYALLKLRPAEVATGKEPLPRAVVEPAVPPAGEEGA
jgi:multicomponent Na+:H+ antiporter subunit A